MSKTSLKKELATLSDTQLRELILDVYTARKEARDYFEFFLDPDVEKLTDKTWRLIEKEMGRSKRGYLACRFSHIMKMLKDYESFGPGADNVLSLMIRTFTLALFYEKTYLCKPAFQNGTARLYSRIMDFAEKHLLFDTTLSRTSESISQNASRIMRNRLKEILESRTPDV
ncbi:MAG: DUF6155 family protein [Bacteroidales bacterium]|nr:DUF6155 family protein [Bacteroidales bacterium]